MGHVGILRMPTDGTERDVSQRAVALQTRRHALILTVELVLPKKIKKKANYNLSNTNSTCILYITLIRDKSPQITTPERAK